MCTKKMMLYGLAIIIGGCIPSLHPLYTGKDVVYDPNLVGVWKEEPNNPVSWNFQPAAEPNAYQITYKEKDKDPSMLIGHLVRIDNMLFLDLFPKDPNYAASGLYLAHFVRAHTFMKIEQITPTLQMRWTSGGINKLLENDPNLLKHETTDKGIVLTASPEELQNFMRSYADANDVFGEIMDLHRMPKE